MYQDRFIRGYATALLLVAILVLAYHLGGVLGEEMEIARKEKAVQALRRIHDRDQREARSDR